MLCQTCFASLQADVDAQLRERQQKTATAESIRRKEAEDTINIAAWETRHDIEVEPDLIAKIAQHPCTGCGISALLNLSVNTF